VELLELLCCDWMEACPGLEEDLGLKADILVESRYVAVLCFGSYVGPCNQPDHSGCRLLFVYAGLW